MSPFAVRLRAPVVQQPQTLEQAYSEFVGDDPFCEPDWTAYEKAVALLIADEMPTEEGHLPSCQRGRFPMDMAWLKSVVVNDEPKVECRECGAIIG